MRILHFSDLHIGVENYGRVDPATGLSTRLLDFLATLDELVEYALGNGVNLVLMAGDAYKGRDPSQTHQRELALRLGRLSAAGIPVFLLVGNHDLPHALGKANAVEIFNTLRVPHVYVGDQMEIYTLPTQDGPLQVVALPWPNRSKLLSRDEYRGMTIREVRQAIEDLLTRRVAELAERLDPDTPAVLAGHVTISGATTGTERSMMLGQDHALLPSAVQRPQLDYVALGHVHKHQVLRQGPMVVYSGSLQRVDFSEEGDTKGFCVVDLDARGPQGQRLRDFQFQPVDARPFLTIEAKVQPGDPDPTTTVVRQIARHSVSGAIVRLRVSLPGDLEPLLRESEVRQALGSAHYVAAVTRDVDEGRRTRITAEQAESLSPMGALSLYLDSRSADPDRKELLLRYAENLVSREALEEDGS